MKRKMLRMLLKCNTRYTFAGKSRSRSSARQRFYVMSERTVTDAAPGATRAGISPSIDINNDADAQLGLRGGSILESVRTHADFLAHQAGLSHEERERAAQRLRIGRPRDAVDHLGKPRRVTNDDLGIPTDPETGQPILDPDDPTLRDRDCDPELYRKSPAEIVAILERRDADLQDGEGEAFWARMMQREVKVQSHGGGSRGGRRAKKGSGHSAVDQAAIHSVAGGLAR